MEEIRYKVVVNHEEQYALWIAGKNKAAGWRDTGIEGMKAECLAYVREAWTLLESQICNLIMSGAPLFIQK